jgi:regulator of protease activity HflC (stomatin/prohibitin superfamily)
LQIDACVYYTVTDPRLMVYRIQDIRESVSNITYAILKNTAGTFLFQ